MTTAAESSLQAACADLRRHSATQAATILRLEAAICRLSRALAVRDGEIAGLRVTLARMTAERDAARRGELPY